MFLYTSHLPCNFVGCKALDKSCTISRISIWVHILYFIFSIHSEHYETSYIDCAIQSRSVAYFFVIFGALCDDAEGGGSRNGGWPKEPSMTVLPAPEVAGRLGDHRAGDYRRAVEPSLQATGVYSRRCFRVTGLINVLSKVCGISNSLPTLIMHIIGHGYRRLR